MKNTDELLKKAKRDYPELTQYYCAYTKQKYIVTKTDFTHGYYADDIFGEFWKGCLRYDGQWAEIISKPEEEECRFKCDTSNEEGKHTCGCYNDALKEKSEKINTPEIPDNSMESDPRYLELLDEEAIIEIVDNYYDSK